MCFDFFLYLCAISTKMKYWIIIVFFAIQPLNVANAQNEQLIRNIKAYIAKIDSLIKHCPNCFSIAHGHGRNRETGFTGTTYFYTKNDGRHHHMMRLIDSIIRNTSSEEWTDDVEKKLDQIASLQTVLIVHSYSGIDPFSEIRKGYNSREYFQYGKLIAIIRKYFENGIEIGRITLYINDGVTIHYEKFGKIEDHIERHHLTF